MEYERRVSIANIYLQVAVEERVRPTDEARYPESHDTDDTIVLLPPINFIFKLLQSRATISVWLYENLGLRIEGQLRVCACDLPDTSCCVLIIA